jgi:formylglycine-generating enzyme required for sulfatase activity
VERVSWYEAIAFCNKLSVMKGKTPVYSVKVGGIEIDWATLAYASIPTSSNTDWNDAFPTMSANGYRLPTEAEWEYAARGGQLSASIQNPLSLDYYYSGSNTANNVGWYSGNNAPSSIDPAYGTKPVGQKQPNALGLYDMSGNLYEWCWDWHDAYTAGAVSDPTGPVSGSFRVFRGGYWDSSASGLRVSNRGGNNPEGSNDAIGFRVACSSN